MKRFFALAALVLGLAACQTEPEGLDVNVGGEVDATITVTIPETETRYGADSDSALGVFNNGILGTEDDNVTMRYLMQIFDEGGRASDTYYVDYSDDKTVNFDVRLVPNRNYTFVVWADVVVNGEDDVDNHYNTKNSEGKVDLTKITLIGEWNPMDESRDAFTVTELVEDYTGASIINLELKRPFAKLRIVTTDMEQLNDLAIMPSKATVEYTTTHYGAFNAYEGKVIGDSKNRNIKHENFAIVAYDEDVQNDADMTLFTDYFFAKKDAEVINFSVDVFDQNGQLIKHNDFNTAIPARRNYLTTISGNVLTDGNDITVTILDDFQKPDNVVDIWDGESKTEITPSVNEETNKTEYVVNSAAELAWLADLVNGFTSSTFATRAGNEPVNFVLNADIDLNNMPWTPIGTESNNFVGSFDGNGHYIKNLNIVVKEGTEGKAYMGFLGYAKNATIKNLTIENAYINIACLDIDHSQGHIGAVVGSLEGNSTIEDVTVKGDIKVYATQDANGASRVAVVAGGNSYGDVTMKNVHVRANEGSYLKANNNVGALAGQLQGVSVFENCSSNIDVTGTKFFAGGIIGLAAGDQTFTNCHTTGDITITAGREGKAHDHYRVGGIAGGWADGAKNVCTLTNCSYTGQLSGTNADGSVAEAFDYAGYVGRGYTLNGCQGSKVVIDGVEYVQAYNTAAEAGIYYVNGELVISTASAFKLFANKVNGGETFAGKTVKLGADINLNNEEWTPIGSAYADHGFMGNFDGNGYTIKNLTIKNITPDSDGYVYAGLFGVTEGTDKDNQNYIKNLVIENVDIDLEGHIVAAAIAYPYYTDIENVTVKGNISIKGGDYTAGVLAYTRRCVDAKNITINGNAGSVIEGNETIGGVISDIQMNGGLTANYSNFAAYGVTIKGTKSVGGISGIISQQTLDGATVKNVTIVCEDDRKGIVAGADGGKSTIENVVYENVTGATRIIGATYKGAYYVGKIVEVEGQKAVVFSIENGVKAVSVAEQNLKGLYWQDAMDWAAALGEGWALASMEDLNAIYDLRCELNDALEADNTENALFWEGDELYVKNGSVYYALYMSRDEVPVGGVDANGNEYFANRVFFKIFNKLGYSDVLYSAFDCINKYAPLRDNYFARAVYTL